MLIKFKPNVQFQGQTEAILHVVVDHKHKFFNLPKPRFEYSRLISGISEEAPPASVTTFLLRAKLIEKTEKTEASYALAGLSCLQSFVTSSEAMLELVGKIQGTKLKAVDLISPHVPFSTLEKYMNVSIIEKWDNQISIPEGEANLLVLVTDNYQRSEAIEINRVMIAKKVSWLLICQDNFGTRIGPFFDNQSTKHCYNCFLSRIQSNEESRFFDLRRDFRADGDEVSLRLERNWAEVELLKKINDLQFFEKYILHFDSVGTSLRAWSYLPYPICEVCKS